MPQPSRWPARLGEPNSTCALCTHDGFPQASLTTAAREDLSECKPELSVSKTFCWLWPYLAKGSSLYSPVSRGSRSGPTSPSCLAWFPGAPTCLTSASFPHLEGLAVPSAWTVLPQDPCLQLCLSVCRWTVGPAWPFSHCVQISAQGHLIRKAVHTTQSPSCLRNLSFSASILKGHRLPHPVRMGLLCVLWNVS